MKVVVIAPHFFPRVGGVENYVLNVARELRALEWTVVIVTTGRRLGHDSFEGMTVYRLKTALTLSNTPVGFGWRRQLKRIFSAERPDLVNAHTPVPYLADLAQRESGQIPYVLTYHNDLAKDFLPYKVLLKILNRTLISRTLRGSTEIIATSDHYLQQSRYLRNFRDKTNVVHPGVDLSRFKPGITVPRELAEEYENRRVVLFVGSLNRSQGHKGLGTLIQAFGRIHSMYPDAVLVVVGAGDGMEMYKAHAGAAGITRDVVFTGCVEDRALAQYYKLATVFAMPSTDRSEGFGMVYLEASAVGIPVIGSAVGGVPFAVLDDETGLLVEPRNVESLCKALRRILDDDILAKRLGENGSARASKEFAWSVAGGRTHGIFMSVLEKVRGPMAGSGRAAISPGESAYEGAD
jgi:glycosyltransferase involved in cell wall biosynthesis